jgi:CHAT domain-containing protein
MLPLHAAGRYAPGSSDTDTVPGRVVSSYASSLASLRRAREAVPADYPAVRQLVIGMPDTPGRPSLPAVPAELQAIETSFPLEPGRRHQIKEKASRAAVLRALPRYRWAHLACHAYQDHTDPSASALALWDGPLTLAELASLRIRHADLLFLSACQTATGSSRLPDESIHFAAAAQLLGYQHVIATMWSIADAPTDAIARDVYTQLAGPERRSPGRAARALHHATGRLRASHPDNPLLWAPYVHLGP